MIFKAVKASNFLSFKTLELNLENRGLLLLNGKNLDNPMLNNNGAGKSSVIESIVYALYGKTLRGLKGDEVVHSKSTDGAEVVLELEDDGTNYIIKRYRKHKTYKNKSILYRDGVDITPKSEADFESCVSNLLQADYTTFTASLLYSADSFKFATATDSEIKKTLDTMLGLDILSKSLEITRKRLNDVVSEKNKNVAEIEFKKKELARMEEKLKHLEQSRDTYESNTQKEIDSMEQSLKSLEEKAENLNVELETLLQQKKLREDKLKKIKLELSRKRNDLEKVEELRAELKKVEGEIKDGENDIKVFQSKIDSNTTYMEKLKKTLDSKTAMLNQLKQELNSLVDRIGQPCTLCGQPLTEESLEVTREEYTRSIDKLEDELEGSDIELGVLSMDNFDLKKSIDTKAAELRELHETKEEFEKILNSCKILEQQLGKLEESEKKTEKSVYSIDSDIKAKQVQVQENSNLIVRLSKQLESMVNSQSKNPFVDMVVRSLEEIMELENSLENQSEGLESFKAREKNLRFWETAFSNQGIKSYILDDITPFLNRRLNKYLSKLTSGQVEAVFSTVSTLKSGQQREKFNLSIVNSHGGENYAANSSGEKKRIDLAINLALQDMIAARSTKKLNIAIFDEVFDSLDETGIDGVVSLLTEVSAEKSTILVVSHNEYLKSFFTNVLTVVKENGFSHISLEE